VVATDFVWLAIGVLWCALWLVLFSEHRHARKLKRLVARTLVTAGLVAGTVIVLAISIGGVWQGFSELPSARAAAAGNGIKGTFIADDTYPLGVRYRSRVWQGRFVSDDGTVVRDRIQLEGAPPDMALGRPVPAVDTGAARVVYGESAGTSAVFDVMAILLGLGVWIAAAWFGVRWLRRRRNPTLDADNASARDGLADSLLRPSTLAARSPGQVERRIVGLATATHGARSRGRRGPS
jgi:hypothetical protein